MVSRNEPSSRWLSEQLEFSRHAPSSCQPPEYRYGTSTCMCGKKIKKKKNCMLLHRNTKNSLGVRCEKIHHWEKWFIDGSYSFPLLTLYPLGIRENLPSGSLFFFALPFPKPPLPSAIGTHDRRDENPRWRRVRSVDQVTEGAAFRLPAGPSRPFLFLYTNLVQSSVLWCLHSSFYFSYCHLVAFVALFVL